MSERKTARRSPTKPRTLNRWDDDLDKGLMLCIQYACSEAGLKIPWARVAEIMGPTFTDGGIIQHLAKLRNLMVAAGIPVPPSVKRGMLTKSPSKIYGSAANPRVKHEPIEALFPNGTSSTKIKQEEDAEPPLSIYERGKGAGSKLKEMSNNDTEMTEDAQAEAADEQPAKLPAKSRARPKAKSRARRGNMSEEEDEEQIPELYDSESDYSFPKKRRRTSTKSRRKASTSKGPAAATLAEPETAVLLAQVRDAQEDNVAVKVEEEESGPASRTRGVKRDYTQMAAPSSEEIEIEDGVQQEALTDTANPSVQDKAEASATEAVTLDDSEYQEGELEVEFADSDAETDIANPGDAAVTEAEAQDRDEFPVPSKAVNTPYGQLKVDTDLAAIMAQQYQSANVGFGHNFGRVDYLHGSNAFSGNRFGFGNNSLMNFMPQGNAFNSQLSNASLYSPTPLSSANNSMNNSLGYANLPTMSNDPFLDSFNFGNGSSGDMINQQDPANSMPDSEVFDYLVDA